MCNVSVHSWRRIVSVTISPQDDKTPAIELDIGFEDGLTLVNKITEQFQKEHI